MKYNDTFKDAVWLNNITSQKVIIIGSGGIGSWTAFLLTKAGFNVTIIDDDIVEKRNIAGQLFKPVDTNTYKVIAISNIIKEFSDISINSFVDRLDKNSLKRMNSMFQNSIIVSAVDNVETRKLLFDYIKENNVPFVDGRLDMEFYQVFFVRDEKDYDKYEKSLEIISKMKENRSCTLTQTTFASALIGSRITSLLINYCSDKELRRSVPFKFEESLPNSLVTIETN